MQNFQDKRARRKLIYSHATIVVLVVIFLLLSHAVWGIYQKKVLAKEGTDAALRDLAVLQERKTSLEVDIARLSTAQGKEAELRGKFQVAKPGEEVIVVVEGGASTSTSAVAGKQAKSFLDVLREFFGRL